MASPVDAFRSGTSVTTAATSHVISCVGDGGGPNAGDVAVVFFRAAAAPGTVTFTGYTQLASDTSDASDDQTMVFYRACTGTEGTGEDLTTGNSVKLCAIYWIITGAESPATQAPEISTVATGTTTANTADSASRAVTGGPKDVLYLTMAGGDGEVGSYSAAPTNYTNRATANTGTGGAAASNAFMGGASRQIAASSSEDPGAWTHGAHSNGWTAYTVVVHPPGAATDPAEFLREARLYDPALAQAILRSRGR
jgi:hypothetical protein